MFKDILIPHEFIIFGNIDRDDDHSPIRGITASVTHKDKNYSVGTINGYDMRILTREDNYEFNKSERKSTQLIIEITLKKYINDNPTLLTALQSDDTYKSLISKTSSHHHITPYENADEIHEFHSRYALYCREYTDLPFTSWLDVETQQVLSVHAWPLSFEVDDKNKLYVYITEALSATNFDRAIKIGVWLADKLDNL